MARCGRRSASADRELAQHCDRKADRLGNEDASSRAVFSRRRCIETSGTVGTITAGLAVPGREPDALSIEIAVRMGDRKSPSHEARSPSFAPADWPGAGVDCRDPPDLTRDPRDAFEGSLPDTSSRLDDIAVFAARWPRCRAMRSRGCDEWSREYVASKRVSSD